MSRTSPASHRSNKRRQRRLVKRILVSLLLVLIVVVGARSGVRYAQGRIRDELYRRVAEFAERAGMTVELGEVRVKSSNEVSVRDVSVGFSTRAARRKTLAHLPRVEVQANLMWALLRRSFPITVTLFDPQLNLERRADGSLELPLTHGTRETGPGALSWDDVYSLIVHVRSGCVDVREEDRGTRFRLEGINLSLRSSADKRALRIESTLSLPSVSDNPLTLEGWIYPSEGRFDIRQRASALNALAINQFITNSPLDVRGGTVDWTLDVHGVVGKSTVVRGPLVFSVLQVCNVPEFLREIDGTANMSVTVNRETKEILVEKLAIDTGFSRGSLLGTVAFSGDAPVLHLKGEFDRFPVDEFVNLVAQERFPGVSEATIELGQNARLDMEIHGDVKESAVDVVASCPGLSLAFTVESDAYGIFSASADLAQTVLRWNTHDAAALNTAISDATLRGEKMPFAINNVSGLVSLRDGIARTDSLTMFLDDVPVAVSGYADLSQPGVPEAGAAVRCTIQDLSRTRHTSAFKELKLSGSAQIVSNLHKLGESVRWDVDADLTGADLQWHEVFHKPAGSGARVRLNGSIDTDAALDVGFSLSLAESNIAGRAIVTRGDSPSLTALSAKSETLNLAEVMALFDLPLEISSDAGAKLVLDLNAEDGTPSIAASLAADHMVVSLEGEGDAQPVQLEFERIETFLEGDASEYRTDLRCAAVELSPPIDTLVKRGYRPRFLARLTSPVRIDANVDRLMSAPCEIQQLRCAMLLSRSGLAVPSATGRVADGTFELQGDMIRDKEAFSLDYHCEGLDIGEVLSWVWEESDKFTGALSANFSLSGDRGEVGSRSGRGSLRVTTGEVDSSYVISRMQGLDNNAGPHPIQFDTLQCDFSLDNDTINVSNLRVEKPGLLVRGGGTITLDGEVDHTFDVEMSRSVAEELSTKRRWGLMEALPLPRIRTDPITRTFTVKGQLGSLETEVEKRPLHVELVRGTLAFSETLVVAGVTVITAPARMFMDILTSTPAREPAR